MKTFYPIFIFFIVFLSCSSEPVEIPDSNLAAVVREALDLTPDKPIRLKKLEKLKRLSASNRGISDLTGLEKMTGLTSLSLDNNQIRDIAPLASLTQLITLSLSYNPIGDFTPLTELTQLQRLDCRKLSN